MLFFPLSIEFIYDLLWVIRGIYVPTVQVYQYVALYLHVWTCDYNNK
jgi:hypothetical protein